MLCDLASLDRRIGLPSSIRRHYRQGEADGLRGHGAPKRMASDAESPDVADGEQDQNDAAVDPMELSIFLYGCMEPGNVSSTGGKATPVLANTHVP